MTAKRRASTITTDHRPNAAAAPATTRRWREIDATAVVAAVLCILQGYLSRGALSPDGVSYLDLATAMRQGDWSHFVQGYWSPLLPFVVGAIGLATGMAGPALVPVVHALNTAVALGGLAVIWWWARRARPVVFGRAAISAFVLCSYGLPRVEAVTPDVLLLGVAIWLSYELLQHGGERWLVVGVLLGVAFLTKTSTWPWLILAVPLRLWAAQDAGSRRRVLWSTATCAAIMSLWIVPMSVKAGRPTLGSSGRLNFSWYFLGDSSRLPDDDRGRHGAYQEIPIGDGWQVTLATFDDAARWTYQPWGDPTAWAEKVLTNTARTPTPNLVVRFWTRLAGLTFGRWLLPMFVAVLVPAYLLQRRRGMWRALVATQRDELMVMALGVAGLLQFVAIHAEPRLIAPFGGMLALGFIHWCWAEPLPQPRIASPTLRVLLAWLGAVAVVGLAVPRLADGIRTRRSLDGDVAQLRDLQNRLAAMGQANPTIAVVGAAAPLLSDAYRIGAHIAAQIPPRSAALLSALPPRRQTDLLMSVFRGKVPLVWQRLNDGRMQMWIVPPQQP